MSDLIERDKAYEVVASYFDQIGYSRRYAKALIDKVPYARPKGEWTARTPSDSGLGAVYECPYCKYEVDCVPTNFCPNCGADMREREGE